MTTRKFLSAVCLCLLATCAAFAQSNGAQTGAELNLTLGEQRVRFSPTRSFQEMRLEVVNSLGEMVFTHTTAEAEFDWNLRAANSEALAPGLYRYVLSLKFGENQTRQHTGHFIVEKGQDQIWLTASDGSEVSGTALNAARSGGRSVAGFRTAEGKAVTRDVNEREFVDEKGNRVSEGKDSTKAVKQEKAALLGTVNMVAKYDGSGVNLIDSAITEAGGNVGIGTTFPNTKLSVSANSVAPPGEVGIISYFANANESNTFLTADSYGNGNVHSDFLFRRARGTMASPLALQANDIVGQIQARGYGASGFATTARAGIRMTAAENWSNTAQGAYLAFMTTPKLSASINVERMRISDAGNVGIGTTSPTARLDIETNGGESLQLTDYNSNPEIVGRAARGTAASPSAVQANDNLLVIQGRGYSLGLLGGGAFTDTRAQISLEADQNWDFFGGNGTRMRFHTTANGEFAQAERMRISSNGNVGIGTSLPTYKLHVEHPGYTGILSKSTNGYSAIDIDAQDGDAALRLMREGMVKWNIRNNPISDNLQFNSGVNERMRIDDGTGAVHVNGTLSKGGGSFKIDHPLDPENKYLFHSFVESPDMMNIYNGLATLGEFGMAEIRLPDWFESLNSDYRYQLTAIGMPGPNLYVAEEVKGNHFKIAGGTPDQKVSWQVTGIRKDAFANKNRIPVEELKPEEERGTYLHPEAFGQPKTRAFYAKSLAKAGESHVPDSTSVVPKTSATSPADKKQ